MSIFCNANAGGRGRVSLGFFVALAEQMVDVLQYLHAAQEEQLGPQKYFPKMIIPANIMVTKKDGRIVFKLSETWSARTLLVCSQVWPGRAHLAVCSSLGCRPHTLLFLLNPPVSRPPAR